MSTADVEDLLAERGIGVSRETIGNWVNRFGRHFTRCIRLGRPKPNNKWHLDKMVIVIGGVKYWLWRAIDGDGDVLDILVQSHRNAQAARRFFGGLVTQFGEPRVVVTVKLRSYTKPVQALAPDADHRAHKGLNDRIENSHRPTRKREKIFLAGLNCPGKRNGFCRLTIRSTRSSGRADTPCRPPHTGMQGLMHSDYGRTTPAR